MARVRDERLCWLILSDRLLRRSRRAGVFRVIAIVATLGVFQHLGVNRGVTRMRAYAVAVDHVAGFLDDDERAALRADRTLPRWFRPEVERVARLARRKRALPAHKEDPGVRRARLVRRLRLLAFVALAGLAGLTAPAAWMRAESAGRLHSVADAPGADVAIVFGAQVAPGGTTPMPFLRGRLDVGAELYRAGKARVLLVSGDRRGSSGNETAVMRGYLLGLGVPADRIVEDPDGVDTYDTCRRAHDVYGLRRALLVSQPLHLPRAVTLCRSLGVDAHGVTARCDGCRDVTVAYNTARELLAGPKAAWDVGTDRPPAVRTPPDPAVRNALNQP